MPRFIENSCLYGWDAPKEQLKSVKRYCLLFAGISAVLSLVCGVLPTGVTRHNWVSFGATTALVALMLEIIAVIRFSLARSQLDYRTFHSIHWMMDYAPLFHAVLMGIAFIAGIFSCIQAFTGALDLLALLLFALATVFSLVLRKIYRTVPTYSLKEHEQ